MTNFDSLNAYIEIYVESLIFSKCFYYEPYHLVLSQLMYHDAKQLLMLCFDGKT